MGWEIREIASDGAELVGYCPTAACNHDCWASVVVDERGVSEHLPQCLLADVGDKGGVWSKSPSVVVVAGNVTGQTRSGGGAKGPI